MAPTWPLGKLEVGCTVPNRSTPGRSRPTSVDDTTWVADAIDIASAGAAAVQSRRRASSTPVRASPTAMAREVSELRDSAAARVETIAAVRAGEDMTPSLVVNNGRVAARRPTPSVSQIVIAVAILLLPVVLIYWFFSRIPEPKVNAVDWAPVAQKAQAEAPYPVAVPQNLPERWTAVRARWIPIGQPGLDQKPVVGNTFQLGFLTPERVYIGLDQRDVDPIGLIRAASRGGAPDGESTVAGQSWKRLVSDDGRTRSIVRSDRASAVVISGDLPYEALADPDGFCADRARELEWFKPWDQVVDRSNAPFFKWCTGAEVNIVHNCLD